MKTLRFAVALTIVAAPLTLGQHVTTPKEEFGHNFGDDYFLANYKQISAYWQKLATQSNRMILKDIGKTAEGRTQYMAIVSSPANIKNVERYREIAGRLAHAEGLTDAQARALAKEGKAVVWIDGGLHATETLGAQQLGEIVYEMVSRKDEETMRFLNDVVILFVHCNPDGNDLVADWYMRNPVPEQRSLANLPRLYQKYIGHDNNRDFFASTQAETKNMNRVLYTQWFPQILYNHHQSGPAGTVVYSPPLRDPYNYNLDPGVILGLQSLGAAMDTRLVMEGKGGLTMRTGASYDGWWNGGIRNTATFHNTIAMLTEMIGGPTPERVTLSLPRQIPSADLALPIAPQEWHFKQSIDYSMELDRAVLNYASRNREDLLYNIYQMGRNSIERGNKDTWTANPRRDAAVAGRSVGGGLGAPGAGAGTGGGRGGGRGNAVADSTLWAAMHTPDMRDPRGWIIPKNQPDIGTAKKFVNALLETGIEVNVATQDFEVAGKHYDAGSFVIYAAQAFRPHVMDMLEPQVHPDVIPYPGASPTPPYDIAGWTLAFQMGVQFDRILDPFTAPVRREPSRDLGTEFGASFAGNNQMTGWTLSRKANNSFTVINRLLKAGAEVYQLSEPFRHNCNCQPGDFFIRVDSAAAYRLERQVSNVDAVRLEGTTDSVPTSAIKVMQRRIGVWDQYGGSIDAGWTRWILEQFEFPFERVFAPQLDAGNLIAKYDVLVFVDGALPAVGGAAGGRGGGGGGGRGGAQPQPGDVPAEYQSQIGRVTVDVTYPKIKEFIENGGTVIAIGGSALNLAGYLALPIEDHLVENGAHLAQTKFFVPGSVLTAKVDTTNPAALGMTDHTDFFYDRGSQTFAIKAGAAAADVSRIAWYDSKTPLHSGWALGQEHLEGGLAAVAVKVGKGNVLLYGADILQRAQPHGTFKLLFNGFFYGLK